MILCSPNIRVTSDCYDIRVEKSLMILPKSCLWRLFSALLSIIVLATVFSKFTDCKIESLIPTKLCQTYASILLSKWYFPTRYQVNMLLQLSDVQFPPGCRTYLCMLMSCWDGRGAFSCLTAELTWHLQISASPCTGECEIRLAPVQLRKLPWTRSLHIHFKKNYVNLLM